MQAYNGEYGIPVGEAVRLLLQLTQEIKDLLSWYCIASYHNEKFPEEEKDQNKRLVQPIWGSHFCL